ncbi:S41 family peptidase [Salegentibacter flavus]|uniref:C-terminal processing protease CtpA/Prc, contains a PDZ domain n=1 Tax=Salegentibacter flavus TaxID=287099 RepID=A0A1I4YKX8_9FLAO|nr:S41 family peptidase [Salegentibacter flavus]SFN38728.1 C-terminal processing protease CtpA/Prc, contains a PDZ domain [Salegentibacter flavus]
MKIYRLLVLFLFSSSLLISCSKDDDDVIDDEVGKTGPDRNLEVEDFIYKGMNNIYLYKTYVPKLADSYFSTQADLNDFLDDFDSPEDLFYDGLVYEYRVKDKFSFMTDDYIALEERFAGTSTTTGMNYGFSYHPNDNTKVLLYVRYVQPNTSAADAGIERGMIFDKVDGQVMTPSNYGSLVSPENFTLHEAEFNEDNDVIALDQTYDLSKAQYTANPVFIAKTLDVDGKKVGYLMYNSFTADFDPELNAAFANFQAEGIDELVLDIRYNGGGRVETAVDLSSMITGQFEGEIFNQQQWNPSYQQYFKDNNPDRLVDRFNNKIGNGDLINSLNLEKVYIIAGRSSASASELVINGLDAWINVVHVGQNTVGKFQASVTLYDSDNFGKQNANPDHKYAIQPLVYKSANALGNSDYVDGLVPDIAVDEYINEYKPLGDPSEPLLKAALEDIQGIRKASYLSKSPDLEVLDEAGSDAPDFQKMFTDEIPPVLFERNDY